MVKYFRLQCGSDYDSSLEYVKIEGNNEQNIYDAINWYNDIRYDECVEYEEEMHEADGDEDFGEFDYTSYSDYDEIDQEEFDDFHEEVENPFEFLNSNCNIKVYD